MTTLPEHEGLLEVEMDTAGVKSGETVMRFPVAKLKFGLEQTLDETTLHQTESLFCRAEVINCDEFPPTALPLRNQL